MRLSSRVCQMVERGIQNLDVLQMIKDGLDYEIISGKVRHPDADGYITVYKLQLFGPTSVVTDHVTNDQDVIIMDPYCDQDTYDRAVRTAYEEIVAMQDAAEKEEVPDDLRSPTAQRVVQQALGDAHKMSSSGLIIG